MVRAAALVLALIATPLAAAPDRFDLVCSGTTRTQVDGVDTAAPFDRHYRIDLRVGRWCAADCGSVHPIAEVQQSYLMLEPGTDEYTPEGHRAFTSRIGRDDGREIVSYAVIGRHPYTSESHAQCTPAPFSGFPVLKKAF